MNSGWMVECTDSSTVSSQLHGPWFNPKLRQLSLWSFLPLPYTVHAGWWIAKLSLGMNVGVNGDLVDWCPVHVAFLLYCTSCRYSRDRLCIHPWPG